MGDRAEVLDEFVTSHADAMVLDRDGLGLFVGGDGDLELELVVVDILFCDLRVAQFFQRIRGIGNELTHEDFFLGVERVDNDIEELFDLSLELKFLWCGLGHVLNKNFAGLRR